MKTRRFFAGTTLPQALMAAARYHALPPEELAYRLREKRHGFVSRVRRFIVEIDPEAPRRAASEARVTPLAPAPVRRTEPAAKPAESRPEVVGARADERREGSPSRRGAAAVEPFLPPDEETEIAASVAVRKLLALAKLDLAVRVEQQRERLLISLDGPDAELLRELGEEFLDDLEHLVPRAIRGLAGRMVRCKVEGAGLRSVHEEGLRRLAEETAAEVMRTGQSILLDPLSAADRRIVHLTLADDPRVATESEGYGTEKRIRISPIPLASS